MGVAGGGQESLRFVASIQHNGGYRVIESDWEEEVDRWRRYLSIWSSLCLFLDVLSFKPGQSRSY